MSADPFDFKKAYPPGFLYRDYRYVYTGHVHDPEVEAEYNRLSKLVDAEEPDQLTVNKCRLAQQLLRLHAQCPQELIEEIWSNGR